MNDRVGNVSFPAPQEGRVNSQRPYSEQTCEVVDEEVRTLVNAAYARTVELLESKKEVSIYGLHLEPRSLDRLCSCVRRGTPPPAAPHSLSPLIASRSNLHAGSSPERSPSF